jgi:hypothetical protein
MWIADVGQNLWEEINWLPVGSTSGVNYGWRCYEGAHIYSGGGCAPTDTVSPIFDYPHNSTTGGYSVTGGYVYRGPDPQNAPLLGTYITADYVSGNIWTIKRNGSGGWNISRQAGLPGNISSFGEGTDGTLYALGRSTGTLYKIMLASIVPVTLTSFNAVARVGYNELEWLTSAELNTRTYHVEYSTDGSHFTRVGQVLSSGNSSGRRYTFQHRFTQPNDAWYRLVIEDIDGSSRFSDIIRVQHFGANVRVYPTVIQRNGTIKLFLPEPAQNVQLTNTMGVITWQKDIRQSAGLITISITDVPAGVYLLRVFGHSLLHKEKIIIE